jgi:DNA-binding FadR family transcriptional regulator
MTKVKAGVSLAEQAAQSIMEMILTERRFQTGDKLPNEMELAEELGISRVTLREAIRILCTRGLVEIRRGRGTYVISRDPRDTAGEGIGSLTTSGADLRDLLEIRLMVEPMAAYYAAKRATEEELERIEALCRRIEELDADGESVLREEQDFHNAIAMASHNRVMEQLLPVINKSSLADVHDFKVGVTFSLQDHHQIVQYLRARNAEGAKTVMRLHIIHAYQVSGQTIE